MVQTQQGGCRMKAIVVTDQAAGMAGMTLVERPEPQAALNDVIIVSRRRAGAVCGDRGTQRRAAVRRVRDGRLRTNIGNVATLDDAVAALIRPSGSAGGRSHSPVSDTRPSTHQRDK
jgi:hypothetical protein